MKRRLPAASLLATLLAFILVSSSCGDEDKLAPNRLSDIATCTAIELDRCTENSGRFAPPTQRIYVTAKLNNATYGVKASCALRYLENDTEYFATVDITVNVITEDLSSYLVFYFTNDQPWPAGEYEVTVSTDTPDSKTVSKRFRVE